MGVLNPSKKLQGDYGELVFEHCCMDNNYAYISLEEIYNTLTPSNKLVFRKGYDRISIKLPDEIIEEVRQICKPSNENENSPSFVFDYFTILLTYCFNKNENNGQYYQTRELNIRDFHWVEIKTGKSELTPNQRRCANLTKIQFDIFRIPIEIPNEIQYSWENKYEWVQPKRDNN